MSSGDVAAVWMHAITYRTDMLREMGYRQTEGVPFTDQDWVFYPMACVRDAYYLPVTVYRYWVGREGQTVEENYYIQNFHVIYQLTIQQIERFQILAQQATQGGRHFMTERIYARSMNIYHYYLLRNEKVLKKAIKKLITFDELLKRTLPKSYKRCGDVYFSRRIPIKYVNAWRAKKSGQPLMWFFLQFVCLPIARIKMRLGR